MDQLNLLLCSFYNSESYFQPVTRCLFSLLQYLLSYLNSLKPWVPPPQWENANVSQMAWNLLQDSFHLPIKEAPEILALGVLKLAIDSSGLEISTEGTSILWWKVDVQFSKFFYLFAYLVCWYSCLVVMNAITFFSLLLSLLLGT